MSNPRFCSTSSHRHSNENRCYIGKDILLDSWKNVLQQDSLKNVVATVECHQTQSRWVREVTFQCFTLINFCSILLKLPLLEHRPPSIKGYLPVSSSSVCTENQPAHHSMQHFITLDFFLSFLLREELRQEVKIDHFVSSAVVMNTGAPQRCTLSSLLYSHFTHDCIAKYDRDHIIKFASGKTDRGNSE